MPCAFSQESKPSRNEIIKQIIKDMGISPDEVEKEPWRLLLEQDNWYHQCKVMEWPTFGRADTRTVAPAGGQAEYVCKGTDDDIVIQQAIDSLPKSGGKVVLLPGIYVLGSCIRPKDNTELEIHGTLRVANAVTSPLTADVTQGQTALHVADASKFRVGQWITLMDDDPRKDFHGGRKYGESVCVRHIEGNTITVSDPLCVRWARPGKHQVDGYTVARRAYLTTSHSAILVLNTHGVYIHGDGEIDGNKAGQSATSPLACDRSTEDLRANCGISIVDSSRVKVEGLRVHDSNLHNIALQASLDCEVNGVEAARANDKNICLLDVGKTRLINNYCHDSVVEDGICCHSPMRPYIVIVRNRTIGNPRFGIHLGFGAHYSIVARNVSHSNRINFGKWDKPGHPKQVIEGLLMIDNSFDGKQ